MPHWLYLHGFKSGPGSLKACETRDYLAKRHPDITLHCPALSPYPAQALAQAAQLITRLPEKPLLIGSSLGGFYATALAERFGLRAVLINPSVRPFEHFGVFGGVHENPYHGECFTLGETDRQALQQMFVAAPTPAYYWLVQGSHDKILDWREAARHYAGCRMTVLNGDDHRLARWPQILPAIAASW
ncbi:YqiA/YcfP family alpha/beta fold hydrolase [Craterilacuibacter sp.]|uniref:YqiA/YcfP family alpha/beta fold hydrolase n=1 Tax=Craterilacuibacter sp. TaxID=2870909 RepID=UPI003F3B1E9E